MASHARAQSGAAAKASIIRSLAESGLSLGIAAWTEPSLVESGELYPPDVVTAEQRLRYYAECYPLTEVDSTFYHPLAQRTAALWAARTPPGFVFDVKAFRLLTHHPTPPSTLWRDLREALPPEQAGKPRVYARDLPRELVAQALRRFAASVEPLRTGGHLGIVLFQLPRYVYPSRASYGYLEWVSEQLPDVQVGVEFRQSRWMDDDHCQGTLDFLTRHGLTYVCVDEPQGFPSSVPPVAAATSDVAVVRFHGRNTERWEARGVRPVQRHTYEYRPEELAEWVPRIRALHEHGRPVHLIFTNVHRGYAAHSARILARLLSDRDG
ncbi:uncharacterized protein YecE (DUF72 family) [Kribbella steppae]|uniref:Uncharacterized protein YecE (DUF72 family) n=1 Tax=Kribbella steppae TaxID=2512223 RepID=A0A4R2GYS1_9ACTN|nr:DUF72 domain-containing protein [Kribbella steppae]TCO15736.1 uncharacterized protein YecE (DUF72 family) [Kribbella steppae]